MRFGRKSGASGSDEGPEASETETTPAVGPFDASEVDLDEREGVDLGSLVVTPVGPVELQLQVDEQSGEVIAVVLVGEHGALELRAFAASRGGSAWDELRPRISAEMARLGGTSDEKQGTFGTELLCMVPVQTPEGQPATQASRIVAHEGSAWLLRATMMGPAAVDEALAGPWEETIRQVVVRRGREAMPPGTPLPLRLPPEARRVDEPLAD
ncbi:MAG: hypothetical protein JWQ67_2482 [Marmoricola sp.]|nr:hypothetical protein [Marmoricola sp.]